MAAVDVELLCDVAFVVLTGLSLGEARDEVVDVSGGEVRLVVDRAQGSAVGPHEGQYRRIVWR